MANQATTWRNDLIAFYSLLDHIEFSGKLTVSCSGWDSSAKFSFNRFKLTPTSLVLFCCAFTHRAAACSPRAGFQQGHQRSLLFTHMEFDCCSTLQKTKSAGERSRA